MKTVFPCVLDSDDFRDAQIMGDDLEDAETEIRRGDRTIRTAITLVKRKRPKSIPLISLRLGGGDASCQATSLSPAFDLCSAAMWLGVS